MSLPLPILKPDAIPRDYVSQYFENIFFNPIEIADVDKDKIITIIDLLDVLIPLKHDSRNRKDYFSIIQTVKRGIEYVSFNADMARWKGFFSSINHLIPRKINPPDFGHVEINLLHHLSKNDLESIASSMEVLVQEINHQEFLLFKDGSAIGRYQDSGHNSVLELNVISTHVHNPQHGSLNVESFLRIKEILGERQFYESLGEDWHTIDKLPIIGREFLRKLDDYVRNRIPDIYAFFDYPFNSIDKHAESTSIQSIIDMLLLARRKRKHWKKHTIKTAEKVQEIDYNVLEARLWDVAVSANRVRYLFPQNKKNYGYVEVSLARRIKERNLFEIISKISGAGIRRFNDGNSKGFEFIDIDREVVLGRYIFGYYPGGDDLHDQVDDRIELRVLREGYFSNEAYKHFGYLSKKKYKKLVRMCGSEKIFEVAFGSGWTPRTFTVLPATSKEIISAVDYHIKQRTFKWLDRYNQGGAATGTMTLVRGR